jgi:hypothetical protein
MPPNSRRDILLPGNVLKTIYKIQKHSTPTPRTAWLSKNNFHHREETLSMHVHQIFKRIIALSINIEY